MKPKRLFSVLFIGTEGFLYTQTASTVTIEDDKRAACFQQKYVREKVYNVHVIPRWFEYFTRF
ncbi:MAG: hypothetical protein SFU99_19155 [Saprospiraceae bacterium]|nr:hypothetical protein [Saprospiraceae bacterium]